MIKNIVTSVIVSAIVALGLVFSLGNKEAAQPQTPTLGGGIETVRTSFAQGLDVTASRFDGGVIYKGALVLSSNIAATPISVGNIAGFNTILFTPNVPNTTIQIPAAATFPQTFLPRPGDRTQITVFNATTTTNTNGTIGFASNGAGTIVQVASSTVAITASSTGQTAANITILRQPNNSLLFMVAPFK